ncbi:hypothetical protein EVA_02588 [gut metagenome]|uniref:Uncharacterized protein n=1 Tax=gut metagenome TaxID=749906 RepID=J9D8Z8_9ZZZZ
MEVLLLVLQIGNFGIDGNHGIGKLEQVRQRILEYILADNDVTASTGFKPTITVATQQDCRTRRMVEEIVFYHRETRCTEQRTASPVITDGIDGKYHFGSPGQVLDTETLLLADGSIHRFSKSNQKLACTGNLLLVVRTDRSDAVLLTHQFHGVGTHKLHFVSRTAPFEAPSLVVHIATHQRTVVDPFHHLQIRTMHVDGIVHHPFIQAVAGNDFSLATREMGCIGLGREVTRIISTAQAYAKPIQRNVFAQLCQQSHTLGIVHPHILQGGIHVVRQENTRSRTIPTPQCHSRTRHQPLILPSRRQNAARSYLVHPLHGTSNVAGIIHQMLRIPFESDTITMTHGPAVAIGFEELILRDAIFHPRSRFEHDTLLRIVLYHFHLRNVGIGKVDTEILQCTVFRAQKRQRQHAAMEHELRPLSIESKILQVLQRESHLLRIVLVVIRNVIFAHSCPLFVEVVSAFGKAQSHRFTVLTFRLDACNDLLHNGRSILLTVGPQAIVRKIIHLLR